jgi:hypothetical protein
VAVPKSARNLILLGVLLAALVPLSMRWYNSWQKTQPPPKFNVIVFHCAACGTETEYPQTYFARPTCSKCGKNKGEIKREWREAPTTKTDTRKTAP